jgi:hypothetical protein
MDLIGALQDPGKSPSFVISKITPNLSTDRNSKTFEVRSVYFRLVISSITELGMLTFGGD